MKYLILSIIFFSILITPVSAQEDFKIHGWFEEKIISPVKQLFNSMKQSNLEDKSQEMLEKAQQTIKEKQEELVDKVIDKSKQESKKIAKNWIQRKIEWIEELLTPLKIKIQEGSDLIRGWVEKIKESFK